MLRAHVSAIAGEAAARGGRLAEALPYWETTLRDRPVSFRLLGRVLPVVVHDDGDPAVVRTADLLRRSIRFREAAGGYTLKVSARSGQVMVELFGPNGVLLREAQAAASADGKEAAREFLARLHQPRVDLTQLGIGSLDGQIGPAANARDIDAAFRGEPAGAADKAGRGRQGS